MGHGDSIFLQFPDSTTMLIDGGSGNRLYNSSSYIRGYIQTLTTSKNIDYLLLTHPHIDHCNALADIISWFNISYFYTPDISPEDMDTKSYTKYHNSMKKTKNAEIILNVGIQEVKDIFTIYGASPQRYKKIGFSSSSKSQLNYEVNSISPIAVLEYAGRRIVLTGDATETTEKDFMSLFPSIDLLKTDILKVGHHGRKNSTGELFLDFLEPDYAIISAGGAILPDQIILDRLYDKISSDNILRTYSQGAISIKITPDADIEFYWEKDYT